MKYLLKVICKNIIELFHTMWSLMIILLKTDCKNHIKYERKGLLNILANGPSLSEDIQSINHKDGDFSVVNYFYKSPYFQILKPSIYVIIDPYFFECEESIRPIIEKVTWKMKFIVPYSAWKKSTILRSMSISNSNIEVVPIHGVTYSGFDKLRILLYKCGLTMPKGQNVVVASIFSGINMGYKEIRLYGVDHSWTTSLCVSNENQVCAVDKHFYDTDVVTLEPYLKCTGEYYKLHELLRDFATMFESYHQLRLYADSMGCKIINKTKSSFIDAFERE